MSNKEKRLNNIKQPRYIYFIICVSSVLFIFGIIGWLVLGSKKVESALKEKFLIHIYIKDESSQDAKDVLMEKLSNNNFVKTITFKTKEMALRDWYMNGGEEFMNQTQENFLPESIVVNIKADFVNDVSITKIKNIISGFENVSDVQYPNNIFNQFVIIRKICFYLLFIAFFMVVISLVLLSYLIKLIIFNNRFVIRTMTLVGASNRFISKPFEYRAIINGVISSVIAILGIGLVVFYLNNTFNEVKILVDRQIFVIVFLSIAFMGIFISWLSTYISISRYLRMPLEKLY